MRNQGYSSEINWFAGWRALTVTYRRKDANLIVTKVGYGDDYDDALRDADEQLRPGKWVRLAISQPSSVLGDLRNAGKHKSIRSPKRPGEGELVTVAAPRVRAASGVELSDE